MWKFLFGKLACVAVTIAAITHFDENPIVISVIVCVLSCMVLFFYDEELLVFEDRFIYRPGFALPNAAKGKEYYFRDVKEVVHPVDYNVTEASKD
jgi:hypothetical protein